MEGGRPWDTVQEQPGTHADMARGIRGDAPARPAPVHTQPAACFSPRFAGLCARLPVPYLKMHCHLRKMRSLGPSNCHRRGFISCYIHTCCRAVPGRRKARARLRGDLLPCSPAPHNQWAQSNDGRKAGRWMRQWLHAEDLAVCAQGWQVSKDGARLRTDNQGGEMPQSLACWAHASPSVAALVPWL